MSDNLNDDLDLDESFDDFEKKGGGTLGDLWRDSPPFKIGVIIGAAILIFTLIFIFSGEEKRIDASYVGSGSDITATPGTEEASPAYVQAVEDMNAADIERAMAEGDSSLPVPIDPPVGIVSPPGDDAMEEDPLQRWRRLQEERLEREIKRRQAVLEEEPEVDTSRIEAVQNLADLMAQQMASILESQTRPPLMTKQLTHPNYLEMLHQKEAEAQESQQLQSEDIGEEVVGELLFPAGQIAYAQLLTEANTDSPGPVLAEIMSGPLRGSRILGTFEKQKEFLTLSFDTVVYNDQSLSIDAVALDPETTLPGMATEVDHRYFKRIVLPAAAAFVEGMAGAIAESGRTTVTISGETVAEETDEPDSDEEVATGIEEAGQELSSIIDEIAQETETLIRIETGTPMGILFLEPVMTDPQTEIVIDDGDR